MRKLIPAQRAAYDAGGEPYTWEPESFTLAEGKSYSLAVIVNENGIEVEEHGKR